VAAAALLALLGVLLLRMRSAGRLRVVSGPVTGAEYRLRGPRMTIGALDTCDVVLQTAAVSRHHADLVVRGRRVEIRDRNSTNGTRVNGRPVDVAALQPGDQIRVGDVELVYER
jgi:pSer/pThr/pTyr-binding forkhead associated (FHA) protein